MKNKYTYIAILLFSIITQRVCAGPQLWTDTINHTQVVLNAGVIVLGQINVTLPTSGKVEVHFDGQCSSTVGDLIILAASNIPDWDVNDGNLGCFAWNSNVNTKSFSHTRVYNVTAGANSFYAVGQNYVCTNGSGYADVYGMLTVIFFPDSNDALLESVGFDTSATVDVGPTVLNSVTINPTVPGTAVVRFDGTCAMDIGDRIYLGVNDTLIWTANAPVIFTESNTTNICDNDITFTTTRVFQILPGAKTFYALAENYGETDGNGSIYVPASLTVEFYPDAGDVSVSSSEITAMGADLNNGIIYLGSQNLGITPPGKMLVHFDGVCASDTGDAITLAASNGINWTPNYGSVEVKALNSDINENSFSHTMVYPVSTNSFDCYAVVENTSQTNGNGLIDLNGTLVAIYFPDLTTGVENVNSSLLTINVYPNPSSAFTTISLTNPTAEKITLNVYDVTGRHVKTFADEVLGKGVHQFNWNTSTESKGVYFLRIESDTQTFTKRVVVN